MGERPLWVAVLAGGMAAGALDLVYAFAWMGAMGRSPLWVLQSVASGWMGKAAFAGGGIAGAVGLLSHFGIAIAAAGIYAVVGRSWAFAREHWIVCGALFGVAVYLFMNFAVIPLSAAPFKPSLAPSAFVQGFLSHSLLFGIPIAWFTRSPSARALPA